MKKRLSARSWALTLIAALSLWVSACGVGEIYLLDAEQLKEFDNCGPIEPELDMNQLLAGVPKPGAYRVVAGDVIEIRGSTTFISPGAGASTNQDIVQVRVQSDGTLGLPVVGPVEVIDRTGAGKTLGEIENLIANAIHPKYLAHRPAIVAKIIQLAKVKVTVLGAVERAGIVELSSDNLSLFGALSEAGGILKASAQKVGARVIRIRRQGRAMTESIVLPVRGLNVPYADVTLRGGETIEVERWDPDLFTVVGLVGKPGAYEYPPGGSYNLMQALSIAGGVDRIADPPYATIYRRKPSGEIVMATFPISGNQVGRSAGQIIRPGDVITVDHSPGSWTRTLVAEIFRLQINLFVDPLRGR